MADKSKLYFDSETCGLHSVPVLFQYAEDNGPVVLHDVWLQPVGETLSLLEWMLEHQMVFFNACFDFFQIVKTYTTFRLCPGHWIPLEHINEIAALEPKAQDGPCLKPSSCLDLMLHARKGPYQSLMARDDIRIRRVPTSLAYALAKELEDRVKIDAIYFARTAAPDAPRWHVNDRTDRFGVPDPDFKDVVLCFSPAGGLKYLAEHALGLKPKYHYEDVEPPKIWRPYELGYAPTALSISTREQNWEVWGTKKSNPDDPNEEWDELTSAHAPGSKLLGYAWPAQIAKFVDHWQTNANAREYASDDIVYTRALDEFFEFPEPGDVDSTLACMVAAVRWHGFAVNIPGIQGLQEKSKARLAASPVNVNKPLEVRKYVTAVMDDTERLILSESARSTVMDSTKKANLEALANWKIEEEEDCEPCDRCNWTGKLLPGLHPVARRVKVVLDAKAAAKEVELYTKLLRAGKFHASFIVIGAKSSRMSGTDNLNAQGIKNTDEVREQFPLAVSGMVLGIGDFDSFEVGLADAVYADPEMRKDLESGKKIHGIFGALLHPGMSYEDILATAKTEHDLYKSGKQGFFATILYFGDENTLLNKQGIPREVGQKAISSFLNRYKKIKEGRDNIEREYGVLRQPGGLGTKVVWQEPKDYVESFLGFRRYYTLENKICKALYGLAQKPPKEWRDCAIKVMRRQKVQTASGAVASALYGAAFQISAATVRSVGNHLIQSPGAEITKSVEADVWELQPVGIHPWRVLPMQVHDEIIAVSLPELSGEVKEIIDTSVAHFREKVPMLKMDWKEHANNWAEK